LRAQAAPCRARARQPQRRRPPERTSIRVYTGPARAGALALCAGAAGGGGARARALHRATALAALSLRALAAHAGLAELAAPRAALAEREAALLDALLLLTGACPASGADMGAPHCVLLIVIEWSWRDRCAAGREPGLYGSSFIDFTAVRQLYY